MRFSLKDLSESNLYWRVPPNHFASYKKNGFGTPSGKMELTTTRTRGAFCRIYKAEDGLNTDTVYTPSYNEMLA